ncbi:M56 family metallopeptidase [Paenibacillus sp. GCM10028914]|uniref:M56 family metallopeptidase n=1 Tax=Paenibacillus sp. GCM10028914 TaxID=3273416 RepID=UPI003610AF67
MSHILQLLVTLTVAGSTIVSCILLVRLLPSHIIPPKWRYIMGKMAVWFFILPVAFTAKELIELFAPKTSMDGLLMTGILYPVQEPAPELLSGASPDLTISAEAAWILLSLWLIGTLLFASWQMYCYKRFIKSVKETSSPASRNNEDYKLLSHLLQVHGIKAHVNLAYCSSVKSPVLVGLLKPTILLPASSELDLELGMVIHHELIHLKRKDLWVKMLVLGISCLHWFNPLVHLLRKDIHIWSELSCDEEVVKSMSYAERKRYGETILNVMIGTRELPVKFAASLSGNGQQLKRRLTMMMNVKKLKKRTVFMTISALLVMGAVGTSTAVWAAKVSPAVDIFGGEQYTIEEKGGSHFSDGSEYDYHFGGLSPIQQKKVTKDMAQYYLDEHGNVVDYSTVNPDSIPYADLTPEQQKQATKEIGKYSLKEVRELVN